MITLKWNTGFQNGIAEEEIQRSWQTLWQRNGAGSDFLGWLDPEVIASEAILSEVEKVADRLKKQSQCVVVAGIGGSYLGARAIIEALQPMFPDENAVRIIYAGNHLSEDYLAEMLAYLDGVDYSIVVISKSGTTTETAVSFRLLLQHCQQKYGVEQASSRIVCVTDKCKGALKKMADQNGYTSFVLPDEVGGRYSVLTPVGLLPIALAEINIRELVRGAVEMKREIREMGLAHQAVQYAVFRNTLWRKGITMEVLAAFEPRLQYFIEWWKQLYGESEGKDGKGIFPAGVVYTTDLHSLGQFMQEGNRIMMETFLYVQNPSHTCKVPAMEDDSDQLNYLQGRRINEINQKAYQGTVLAHEDGGVPSLTLEIERLDAFHLGQLVYFFEFACGLSGYLLGVNPFNQPGVEAYKKNMFTLLGKKGYETGRDALLSRISSKK